jgi:membrane protease YdiL (CAAX protease family)
VTDVDTHPSLLRRLHGMPNAIGPLATAIVVSGLATAASWFLKESMVATAVGGIFLGATWLLVLRRRDIDVRAWGLALGGLLEVPSSKEDASRGSWGGIARDTAVALGWALLLAALLFPPFVLGFARWWHVRHLAWMAPTKPFDAVLGQLVVVALPEEAFFRGYLQTALDHAWRGRIRVLGADIGYGLLVASALFALGHIATVPHPARLAVFFPSLIFGWMRARTKGVGAGVAFHTACNLLSEGLARGAGLY